ncbi:XopAD/skwp family type III secretion system effector [Ralstonia solanacearum]|uniref:XopAD/skwp family type III secretion system effector n=1 Tax=Ralstonia solanacearum TaxID=305 RepID=UPI00202AB694|nr:XopAD/skwp family type III secretion system effector [Ralstonia solanacearum]MCL9844390.1 type III effector protein skwp2 [Ralstonia solanacearum]MDC6253289.1 XopAD/skwp family type III secretion system effector [Ralstonia solanacearum]MDC6257837.1 XopAD/skwp family type III secretion system effector [Ralstonia solanacearum]MDC6303935.1 XopAD/skwp family type III secretion system effector [Ralstonia solanacearum]
MPAGGPRRQRPDRDWPARQPKRARHDRRDDAVPAAVRRDSTKPVPTQDHRDRHHRPEAPRRAASPVPRRPSSDAQAAFRKQHARARALDNRESDLLWNVANNAVPRHDIGKALRLLERPAADFADDLACFANFVRAVSTLLESAGKLGLPDHAIDRITRKWEESSQAFYSVHHDMKVDNERWVSKLASLCNRWSQTQPVQGAGCVAVARILETLGNRYGPDLLHNRLRNNNPLLGRDVSLLINAFSKWPEDEACRMGVQLLAGVVAREKEALLSPVEYQPQALARIFNGVSKWPDDPHCKQAAEMLAEALWQRREELVDAQDFKPQELAMCLNGLSKFTSDACERAAIAAADAVIWRHAELRDPKAFTPQNLSMVLNGLSKWPHREPARLAAAEVADALWHRRREMTDTGQFNAQDVSNCLNGLSKWPAEARCRKAATALAEALPLHRDAHGDLPHFLPIHLSNCLNGLSKWPEEESCRRAAITLAGALLQRQDDLSDPEQFSAQHLSNALHGLSKWPEEDTCRKAALAVAGAVAQRLETPAGGDAFTPQQLSNCISGASKWPEEPPCRLAAAALAATLLRRQHALCDPDQFTVQALSNCLNGLSKWPGEDTCRKAALAVVGALKQRWSTLDTSDPFLPLLLSACLNGVSKWPEEDLCRQAALMVVETLLQHRGALADPRQFTPQQLSNCLNGMSKWAEMPRCREAALALAEALLLRREELSTIEQFGAIGLAACLNGLSRWSEEELCRKAALAVAGALLQGWDALSASGQLTPRHLANSLNGVSRWLQDEAARGVATRIIGVLGSGGQPFGTFTMAQLAQLANGTARFIRDLDHACEAADVDAIQGEASVEWAQARLRELAAHLDSRPDRLAQADTRNVALIFKALANTQLYDGLRLLAHQGLTRLATLYGDTAFRTDNLEALASLAAGLLPVTRAPELKDYRADALRLLERIHPAVDRKIRLYLDARLASADPRQPAAAKVPLSLRIRRDGEAFGTRRPGLSFFLLLKAYAVVAERWRRHHVPDIPSPAQTRREALKAWVAQILERTRDVIETDLDEMSWNLIAQIEAGDQLLDAVDLKLHRDLDRIIAAHPPTPLDVGAVRRELRGLSAVRDVMDSDAGAAAIEFIDLSGRDIAPRQTDASRDAAASQYAFFTRLTGGRLPLLEVQLPAKPSTFMLTRVIQRGGDLLRMDLFGGSHLKPTKARLSDLLRGDGAKHETKRYGRIPAVRLADTAPDAALMKDVIRKLNPQREDWFRMQRALLEVVPRDHVVEGPIRLALLPDRLQGSAPAFALRTPEGDAIKLVSDDGCGFIRESLACRIPVIRQAMRRRAALAGESQRMSLLPPQATHHFPRDADAIEEVREHLRASLRDDPELWADHPDGTRAIKTHQLYDALAGSLIMGTQGTAVPSGDDKVYLPRDKSKVFDVKGGPVLLGKAPYDKANLMPVAAERIRTCQQGDATALFLDNAFAFQYSYTAWDESGSHATGDDDAPMLHGKGVTIVVPDAMWPQDNDAQWVWSTEDMKVHSTWTEGRRRDRLAPRMDTVGSLRVKEVFPPGSLIALPISELRKRDADCDGDKVFLYAGLPKMAQAVTRFLDDRERRIGKLGSFKPPKTAHGVLDAEGRYQAGRTAEVLSALRGQELVGRFSSLQFLFFGQPPALQAALAEHALFGTYEGTERELRHGIRALLQDPREATAQQLEDLLHRADIGVRCAAHPVALEVARALRAQLQAIMRETQAAPGTSSPVLSPTSSPTAPPPHRDTLSDALAALFPPLAQAYEAAATPHERLTALVTHYPRARLPHPDTALPDGRPDRPGNAPGGQSGYVPGAPLETLHNLLTLGVKIGTDAPKAVTQTDLFIEVANHLDGVLGSRPDRIRIMPYTKAGVVQELRHGRFHAQANLQRLQHNPTLSAGLMEMAIQELLAHGAIEGTPQLLATPRETEARISHCARTLHAAAQLAEPRMTSTIEAAIGGIGILRGRENRIKAEGALRQKLRVLMHKGHETPEDAAAAMNDTLRYSVVLKPDAFAAGYADIMGNLDRAGLVKTRVQNAFKPGWETFKGINVKFIGRDAEGQSVRLEVQFHTDETFDLKTRYHDSYKQDFQLQMEGASMEQRLACLAEARKACKNVVTPAGCERIEHWRSDPPQVNKRRAAPQAARLPGAGAGKRDDAVAAHIERLQREAGRIEREVGPLLSKLQLQVIEQHSVAKKAKSIEKKIRRVSLMNGIPLEQAADRVRDAMRWVVRLPHGTFGAQAREALEALKANGLRITRVNNGFAEKDRTYAGLNVKLQTWQGLDFEIQFHTADSLYTKQRTHKIYRQWQDQEVERTQASDPARQQALQQANAERLATLRTYAATVPTPVGAEAIPSFDDAPRRPPRQSLPGEPSAGRHPREVPASARDAASAASASTRPSAQRADVALNT